MKKIILVMFIMSLCSNVFALSNIVKLKSTGEIIYRDGKVKGIRDEAIIHNAIFTIKEVFGIIYTADELEAELIDPESQKFKKKIKLFKDRDDKEESDKKVRKDALKATGMTEAQIDALDEYFKQ